MLCTCQPGFESLLGLELNALGFATQDIGPGWVLSQSELPDPMPEVAFAYLILKSPVEIQADSVNALAQKILDYFMKALGTTRIQETWPCVWQFEAELVGLGRRVSAVENAFLEMLKKRMARLAKLAINATPRESGLIKGLFVRFVDFGRAYVSFEAVSNGQKRMADDPYAPSRSYLKVEEAYVVLGLDPQANETVVDLGAAPGGWSYSAARHGAKVIAVDNGPLKAGALNNPMIEHVLADAFGYCPPNNEPVDWLFCDLVEDPNHVLENLITPWLTKRWCKRFVINFKFGRADPIALLKQLRAPNSIFVTHTQSFKIRHLYHDREEFTVVGVVS